MELRDVAHELYGLAPADFTAARNTRAKEARAAKDRALATRLSALPRPSAAAWAVNLLVRRDPGLVDQLLSMGAALREAQASLSGADLRDLNRQQHQLLVEVRRRAEAAARDAGHPLSPTIAQNVHATLHAAMADPDAAEAVRSGLLVADLRSSGFGPVDVDGAVAPVDAPAEDAEPDLATPRRARADVDELQAARRRRAAAGRAPGRSGGRTQRPAEQERAAAEPAEHRTSERARREDAEQADRDAAGRADWERAEQERAERERAGRERAERERAERDRIAAEHQRAERERAEQERAEQERAAAERAAERERAAAERRRRAEVGRRLTRAEKQLAAAERSLAAADETVEDVEARHEQAVREITEVEQQLARLRARRTELDAQLGTAREAADDAAATRDDAQGEVDRLREELDDPSTG